jgi:hypothetical protein
MSKQEFSNIDYSNTAAYKTIKALNKEGVFDEQKLPNAEYGQLQRLKNVDSKIKPEKGIKKIIRTMTRQVVKSFDKDGRPISKEYLTIQGEFKGYSFNDEEYGMSFEEGNYKKPTLVKQYKLGKKFDQETGEDLGELVPSGSTIEYTIEVPKDAAKRKKLIQDIIDNSPGTFPENIHFYYKDTVAGNRDSTFSYEQFTESSIEELRNLSKKGAGAFGPQVWRDRDGKLRDKDGNLIHE